MQRAIVLRRYGIVQHRADQSCRQRSPRSCEEGAAAAFPVFAARGRLLIPRDARIADADNYMPVLDTIHREVDAIEDRVFAAPLSAEEVQLGLLRMQANWAGLLSHARARPAPKTDTHA